MMTMCPNVVYQTIRTVCSRVTLIDSLLIAFNFPEAHDRIQLRSAALPTDPQKLEDLVERVFRGEEWCLESAHRDFAKARGKVSIDRRRPFPECYNIVRFP